MNSLDNPITIKIGQTTLTQEQWRLIMLSTNAANVVYNVDLPLFMVPDGYQRVETGYVLDNQPNFDFMGGGIYQPYPSETGWKTLGTAVDAASGGKGMVLYNQSSNEVMVTFAGMDGFKNAQDQASAIVYNATNQIMELEKQIEKILLKPENASLLIEYYLTS